jgi:hypothetical protein
MLDLHDVNVSVAKIFSWLYLSDESFKTKGEFNLLFIQVTYQTRGARFRQGFGRQHTPPSGGGKWKQVIFSLNEKVDKEKKR